MNQQDKIDLHSTIDAKVWTDEFCRLNAAADHGAMLGWFANAIMAGFDEANRRALATRPAAAGEAGSVQSIDAEFYRLLTEIADETVMGCIGWSQTIRDYFDASLAVAHAEGRRSALEELHPQWLKEKERADRAKALLREARATLEMWKDVAPAVSLCADIDACLLSSTAQPLQQDGGKDWQLVPKRATAAIRRVISDINSDSGEGWKEEDEHAYWAELLDAATQPSDNLQQSSTAEYCYYCSEGYKHSCPKHKAASTAQAEPARRSAPPRDQALCNDGKEPDWSAYAEQEAASATDAGKAQPYGWVQFIDGEKTQNFCRDEAELKQCKEMAAIFAKGRQVEYVPVFATPAQATPEGAHGKIIRDIVGCYFDDSTMYADEITSRICAALAATTAAEPFGWCFMIGDYAVLGPGAENPWKHDAGAFPLYRATPLQQVDPQAEAKALEAAIAAYCPTTYGGGYSARQLEARTQKDFAAGFRAALKWKGGV